MEKYECKTNKKRRNIPLVDYGSRAVHSGVVHSGNCSVRIADDYRNYDDDTDSPKTDNSTDACHNLVLMTMIHAYDSNWRCCNRCCIRTGSDNLEANHSDNLEANALGNTLNMHRESLCTYICVYRNNRAVIKAQKVYPA